MARKELKKTSMGLQICKSFKYTEYSIIQTSIEQTGSQIDVIVSN